MIEQTDSRWLPQTQKQTKPAEKTSYTRTAAIFLLAFVVLVLRRPSGLTNPQFWAQDGATYFHDQLVLGAGSLFLLVDGSYQFLSRFIAFLLGFFNLQWAPFLYCVAALAVAALCCTVLSLNRFRPLLGCDWMRIVLCFLAAAAFPASEIIGNLVNLQYFFSLAGFVCVFGSLRFQRSGSTVVLALAGFLLALSAPAMVIAVPVLLISYVLGRKPTALQIGLLMGLAAQAAILLWQQASPPQASIWQILDQTITASFVSLSNQVILPALMGQGITHSLIGARYTGIALASVLAFVFLLAGAVSRWRGLNQFHFSAATALLLLSLAVPMLANTSLRTAYLGFTAELEFLADRYFYLGCCLFAYLVALAIFQLKPSWSAQARTIALCCVFLRGGIANFRALPLADLNWRSYVPAVEEWQRAKDAGAHHAAVIVPVNPQPWKVELPAR